MRNNFNLYCTAFTPHLQENIILHTVKVNVAFCTENPKHFQCVKYFMTVFEGKELKY
jgi:hypothetical protein